MSTGVGGISLKHIKTVIVSAIKGSQKTPLGRWSIYKNKNTNLVVDYANEDHCGPCGTYIKTVTDNKKKQQDYEELLDLEFQSITTNTCTPTTIKKK